MAAEQVVYEVPNGVITGTFSRTEGGVTEYPAYFTAEGEQYLISLDLYAASPSWDGFEKDVLHMVGLEDAKYIVTNASWTGEPYWGTEVNPETNEVQEEESSQDVTAEDEAAGEKEEETELEEAVNPDEETESEEAVDTIEATEDTVEGQEAEESEDSVDEQEAEEPEDSVDEQEAEEPEDSVDEQETEEPEDSVDEQEAEEPEDSVDEQEAEEPDLKTLLTNRK